MNLRTPLSEAHGLGSAKEGVSHWWSQRLTAIALLPLTIWFLVALVTVEFTDQTQAQAWLASPFNAVMMSALVIALLYHVQLGLQVVIEDYFHQRWLEVSLQVLVRFATVVAAIAALLSVVRIVSGR